MSNRIGKRVMAPSKDMRRERLGGGCSEAQCSSRLLESTPVPKQARGQIRNFTATSFGISVGLAISSLFLLAAQRAPSGGGLSPQELAGKKVFVQRCSICHLPPLGRGTDVKPYGPILNGYMKSPEMEARAQEVIRKGGVRMPGFQYGLEAKQIDDVIAYLKTMR